MGATGEAGRGFIRSVGSQREVQDTPVPPWACQRERLRREVLQAQSLVPRPALQPAAGDASPEGARPTEAHETPTIMTRLFQR